MRSQRSSYERTLLDQLIFEVRRLFIVHRGIFSYKLAPLL